VPSDVEEGPLHLHHEITSISDAHSSTSNKPPNRESNKVCKVSAVSAIWRVYFEFWFWVERWELEGREARDMAFCHSFTYHYLITIELDITLTLPLLHHTLATGTDYTRTFTLLDHSSFQPVI
jgi:hypothetical protein